MTKVIDRGRAVTGLPAAVDEDAFASWIRPHLSMIGRIVRWSTDAAQVEDVVQNTLARAWERRTHFDELRGSPASWLARITLDQCAQQRRRDWRWSRGDRALHTKPAVEARDLAQHLALKQAILSLDQHAREVILLHYYADLTTQQIATVLNRPESTVKSRLIAARKSLSAILGERS